MALDALYANAIGLLSDGEAQRLLRLLERLGFNLCPPELGLRDTQGRSLVLQGLEEFRQHLGGQLSIPMLKRLGQSIDLHQIELPVMEQALLRLASFGGPDFIWTQECAR